MGSPDVSVVNNPPASVGDGGSIPVPEDSTCLGASKPILPQLLSLCSGAWEPKLLSLHALEPVLRKRSHRNEKLAYCNYRIIPAPSN